MPDFHRTTRFPYDYARVTNGLAERLQAYVDEAATYPAGSPQREGILGTARGTYDDWRWRAKEEGALDPGDDARFLAILGKVT
jgi:hypothetical protein